MKASRRIEIRRSAPVDRPALERLAALDSSRPPGEAALVAAVGGELWAALDLEGGAAIADPFRPSGELVELRGCAHPPQRRHTAARAAAPPGAPTARALTAPRGVA